MPINQCGLQAAESNRAVLRYIAEDPDCWGLTPTSGRTREMRITSSSLTANKETTISNELRADRMVPDVIEVSRSSGGEVNFEFSAGSLDDFMQAFLLGAWTKSMRFDKFEGAAVSVENGASTIVHIAGGDFRDYFDVGQRVKTEGFTNPANNNYWEIASMAFGSGTTSLTMTTDTGITEAANAYGRVMDANDVILLKSTVIQAGEGGANAFTDVASATVFQAAITAGTLLVGQKIFVDFKPAYETGTFVITGTLETATLVLSDTPVEEDAFSISDGVNSVTFELDDGPDGVTPGRTAIDITGDVTDDIGAAIVIAVNASVLNVTAAYDTGTNTVTFTGNLYSTQITGAEVTDAGGDQVWTNNVVPAVASVVDGDTVTIHDGENSVTFEFDDDDSFTRGNVGVTIGMIGEVEDKATTAANLQAAIMDQLRKKKVLASASVSSATVTVRNVHPDQAANVATTALTDDTAGVTTTSFAVNYTPATGDNPVPPFGFFTITALADDQITVAENVGTHANGAAAAITIKGSHVRNPGTLADITPQSFSIETGFTDVDNYFLQNGLRVGSFGLSVSSGEIVTGTLNLMGKETTVENTTTLGASPYDVLASTATPILNATVNVGNVYKNGELLATALQAIELTGEAALREQKAVGSTFPAGIGTGRFNLTGKLTSYFETLEMYDHFLAHDTVSIAFDFLDADRNAYWFTIPALKITTDPIAPGGIDQDVLEELEFVALREPNLNTQFMVDRFSSTLACSA